MSRASVRIHSTVLRVEYTVPKGETIPDLRGLDTVRARRMQP